MKKSKLLLAAAILGAAYFIYLISYFTGAIGEEAVSGTIATALVTPHMICVGIAAIFNWIGWAMSVRWGALVAGILYAVSIVLMPIYFMFVIIQMILCFVGFAKLKQKNV
ncbi:hypothetical protein AALA22_00360 [Anaerovoracaceae bacterium 41-7]|jgi:hypothetical protein|uniref:hypothetical protein n=1 Tax=Senimuribacter intestinalis TaxID=2941507 RepID=UPI00203D071E|nr:hypothetical protein [Senimuribacter intestinalis]